MVAIKKNQSLWSCFWAVNSKLFLSIMRNSKITENSRSSSNYISFLKLAFFYIYLVNPQEFLLKIRHCFLIAIWKCPNLMKSLLSNSLIWLCKEQWYKKIYLYPTSNKLCCWSSQTNKTKMEPQILNMSPEQLFSQTNLP